MGTIWGCRRTILRKASPFSFLHTSTCSRLLLSCWLIVGLGLTRNVSASAVTLQFDAHVASVTQSAGGATLPISISENDPIVGFYSFEPQPGGPSFPQGGQLKISLPGFSVENTGYDISIVDNRSEWVPLAGTFADPQNTPIDDRGPGGVRDEISVSCLGTLASPYCAVVTTDNSLSWQTSILFAGDSALLSSEDLTGDPAVWNSFSFREMRLSFTDSDTGGQTFIGAYVDTVEAVPEPNTLCLITSAVAALSFACRRLSRL
jgi:hypothetical protein